MDGFIAKLDPNFSGPETWVYFTYLGGGRDDAVTAMVIDSAGNLDLTGTTTSSGTFRSAASTCRRAFR